MLSQSQVQRNASRLPILIAGATGQLGAHITRHALNNNFLLVNILIRDPTKNRELVSQVEAKGGRVITADLARPETLRDVTRGIHTVISAISGNDENVTVRGQIALAEDCIRNGVKRFVPSDFGIDYTCVTREELLASWITAYKVKVDDFLKTTRLPLLRFYTGDLTEMLFYILSQGHSYWGDENLQQNVTSYENTAQFVVAAVACSGLTGKVTYVGGSYTPREIQDIYNRTRGTNIELKRAGSLQDLRQLIETKKREGDAQTAGFLSLLLVMFDRKSKFLVTDNGAFGDIRPVGLEEFLRNNQGVKL